MNTEILKINPYSFDKTELLPASNALKHGGICAFPTETVYGLGANALDPEAVKKIFVAKGRPQDNPLIVHVSAVEDVYKVCSEVPDSAKKLMKRFWGGPLTLIMKKSEFIPYEVTAGLETVAVRMPSHPIAHELITLCGFPIAAPSANLSGKPSPTAIKHVVDDLRGKVDIIISGGNATYGVESTVLDLTVTPPTILRPGAVTKAEIAEEIGFVDSGASSDKDAPKAPGMKYRHYAPNAPLFIVSGYDAVSRINMYAQKEKGKVGVLTYGPGSSQIKADFILNAGADVNQYAARLFYNLREFDALGADVIYVMPPEDSGIGEAVLNRLSKAASKNAINHKKYLFVCTGNTCRSPMAAAIFSDMHPEHVVSSRGISVYSSSGATKEAESVIKELGLSLSGHTSLPLQREDLMDADYVYTMTAAQKNSILSCFPEFSGKVTTLCKDSDISDPFGGSEQDYRTCAAQIKHCLSLL